MPKLYKRDAQALIALANSIPAPKPIDIDRAKVAAITCKTTNEFCEFLELEPLVFKSWCSRYSNYEKAVMSWRSHATSEIEVAMAKRAVGFTKRTKKDVITRAGSVETLVTETYYPPDPTAAQFWLKNRAPQDWQDKKEVDINVTANIRQWLIEAGGMDQSEIIDITPTIQTEVIAAALNLTDDTSKLEANMLAELEAETEAKAEAETEVAADLNTNDDANLNDDLIANGTGDLNALNKRWS